MGKPTVCVTGGADWQDSLNIIAPNFANCAAKSWAIAPSGARFVGQTRIEQDLLSEKELHWQPN